MNIFHTVIKEMIGEEPKYIDYLDSGNNDILRVRTSSSSYILKRFGYDRYIAYNREVKMRECLQKFSQIAFPSITWYGELEENYYVLMENVEGQSLVEAWRQDLTRVKKEMKHLGELLAAMHEIPVEEAKLFLKHDDLIYTQDYFQWMVDTIKPYLKMDELSLSLGKSYKKIMGAQLEEVVIHADFGPHQVVIDSQGKWFLIDFEYAALGAFADDLAGTEVRLEQNCFPNIAEFLGGYVSVRGDIPGYEPVRAAYMAYNLLAMLTYRLAHKGETPPVREINRLEELLCLNYE